MFTPFHSFVRTFVLLASVGAAVALPNPGLGNTASRDSNSFFVPELASERFDEGIVLNVTSSDHSEVLLRASQAFLQDKTTTTWVPTWGNASTSTSDGQVFSFHQVISGLPTLNSIGRVWVQDSKVTSFQAPAISNVTALKATNSVPEAAVYEAVASQLGVQVQSGAKLLSDYFFLTSTQTATQVWAVPLPPDANAWLAYVDATTGSVVGVQSTLPLPNLGDASHLVPRIQGRSPTPANPSVVVSVGVRPTKTVVVTVTATGPPPPVIVTVTATGPPPPPPPTTRPVVIVTVTATGPPPPPQVTVVVTVVVTATRPPPTPTPTPVQCPFWFPTCVDD